MYIVATRIDFAKSIVVMVLLEKYRKVGRYYWLPDPLIRVKLGLTRVGRLGI